MLLAIFFYHLFLFGLTSAKSFDPKSLLSPKAVDNNDDRSFSYIVSLISDLGMTRDICNGIFLSDTWILAPGIAQTAHAASIRSENHNLEELIDIGRVILSADYYGKSSKLDHLALVKLQYSAKLKSKGIIVPRFLKERTDGNLLVGGLSKDRKKIESAPFTILPNHHCREKLKDTFLHYYIQFPKSDDINLFCIDDPSGSVKHVSWGSAIEVNRNEVVGMVTTSVQQISAPSFASFVGSYRVFIDYYVPTIEWI